MTINLDVLRVLDNESARKVLIEAFRQDCIDANQAFGLAFELGVDLRLS